MVKVINSSHLSEHYRSNLQKYVSEHPGQIAVLTGFNSSNITEEFYKKRDYRKMVSENKRAATERLKYTSPSNIPIGGGIIGNVSAFEIPKKLPKPLELRLVNSPFSH